MNFKSGTLYRAKRDLILISSHQPSQFPVKFHPNKKIKEGEILTFLQWDKAWLTGTKIVKHFLIDNQVVFDNHKSFDNPEDFFEEV